MRKALSSVLVVALIAPPALAQPKDPAQDKVDKAMAFYEAEDLARALEELEAAYALSPRPDILFAMAKIHDERGDCAKAITTYRKFLETKPGPNSTRIATDVIAKCQKVLAASGEPVPAEPVDTRPPQPVDPVDTGAPAEPEPTPEAATRTRPWYTDTLGDGLVAAGTAGLILGGVFYLSARTDVSKANQGGAGGITLDEHAELTDSADKKQLWAGIAAGAGAALIIGGVVRYLTGDRSERITVEATGAGAAVGWRF